MKTNVDFMISVDIETLSEEKLKALITLIGLKETLLTIVKAQGLSSEPVQGRATEKAPVSPLEASNAAKGVTTPAANAEPQNALKQADAPTSPAPVPTFGAPAAPATPFGAPAAPTAPTSPFGAQTQAPAFGAPAAAAPAFGAPAAAAPTSPSAIAAAGFKNPFDAKKTAKTTPTPAVTINPFNVTAPAPAPAAQPTFEAPAPAAQPTFEAPAAQPTFETQPTLERIQFDPTRSRFMFDGVEINVMTLRMQAGLLTTKPEKMAQLTAYLNSMGYSDVIGVVNSWETTKDALAAANVYNMIRSLLGT